MDSLWDWRRVWGTHGSTWVHGCSRCSVACSSCRRCLWSQDRKSKEGEGRQESLGMSTLLSLQWELSIVMTQMLRLLDMLYHVLDGSEGYTFCKERLVTKLWLGCINLKHKCNIYSIDVYMKYSLFILKLLHDQVSTKTFIISKCYF